MLNLQIEKERIYSWYVGIFYYLNICVIEDVLEKIYEQDDWVSSYSFFLLINIKYGMT